MPEKAAAPEESPKQSKSCPHPSRYEHFNLRRANQIQKEAEGTKRHIGGDISEQFGLSPSGR